ncbi:MAG: GH25 family lysozyme, partial [Clostridia bacterium]
NGYNAGVYANYYWVTTKLDMSLLQDYDLWIAKYSDSLGYEGSSIWQYTSSGAVDGINGRVDLNYGYIDYLALNKGLKLNNNK